MADDIRWVIACQPQSGCWLLHPIKRPAPRARRGHRFRTGRLHGL